MENYIGLPYKSKVVSEDQLMIPAAKELVKAINFASSTKFIECKVTENSKEIIEFDINVPVGQEPIYDIRFTERIAVLFEKDSCNYPWVFALRKDFPRLIHLNLWEFEIPRSLCIYEQNYLESRFNWRPAQFIDDIQNWLYLNAYGKLHQESQSPEPFLVWTEGRIILPANINEKHQLFVYLISKESGNKLNLIASTIHYEGLEIAKFTPIFIKGNAQEHGMLRKHPFSYYDLHEFLKNAGIDFLNIIKDKVLEYKNFADNHFLIIVELPQIVNSKTILTSIDYYVFISFDSIKDIGKSLNIIEEKDGRIGNILLEELNVENSKNIKIGVLRPSIQFSKNQAALFNKVEEKDKKKKITLIGVGSLGSSIFMNLTRMGFGNWKLIDEDVLLPHNLARHTLCPWDVGSPKSKALARFANSILENTNHSTPIWDNILKPNDPNNLTKTLYEADLILDISTSIAVEREIVKTKYGISKRVSIFLNQSGRDMVILSEDTNRKLTLDILEFQFYRELMNNSDIENHLIESVDTIRYSLSCRDISNRIPYDTIVLHSSIASNWIRTQSDKESAQISLWRINESDLSVKFVKIECSDVIIFDCNNWSIIIEKRLIEIMAKYRSDKLPNETGGILIGGYDFYNKRIYIVDTIFSPNDSHEYPTSYIRGIEGVKDRLNWICKTTGNNLKYIGEWHSHTKGTEINPSKDDKILFEYLTKEMGSIGLPPLMIILGDDQNFNLIF